MRNESMKSTKDDHQHTHTNLLQGNVVLIRPMKNTDWMFIQIISAVMYEMCYFETYITIQMI